MTYASTITNDCHNDVNGKKICEKRQKSKTADFDKIISNLPEDGASFWLDKGEYDKKECYRNNNRANVEICDVPDDLEEIELYIKENKNASSVAYDLSFQNEDFEKNTSTRTDIFLEGNYNNDDNDYAIDLILNITKTSQTMSDAKYRKKQDTYINKTGFISGKFPSTPYDDAIYRHQYMDSTTFDTVAEYHKSNNE